MTAADGFCFAPLGVSSSCFAFKKEMPLMNGNLYRGIKHAFCGIIKEKTGKKREDLL